MTTASYAEDSSLISTLNPVIWLLHLAAVLSCVEAISGRGKSFLLHACTAPTTLGFKCNQNKLSGLVILTGLDMKIVALKEHATEKQSASEKMGFFFFLNKSCKFSHFSCGLRMYLVKRKHLPK